MIEVEYWFNKSLEQIVLPATCIEIGIGANVEPITNPTEYEAFRAFYL